MITNKYINIVLYDIPMDSKEAQKEYRLFRNSLIQFGYYQLQESVYACKVNDKTKIIQHKEQLRLVSPQNANIRMLFVTRKQFDTMYIIAGEKSIYENILQKDNIIIDF
ncbi:MAG: CRISPR-associated endonuclease Cas2 [Desulfovibrionaceae bacterium]